MREPYQPPTTSSAGHLHDHTHPCHSRTHSRHSREGGNPPCVQTPEETASLPPSTKFDKTRQNPTRFYRTRVRARARGNGVPFLSLGMDWIRRIALELPSHSRHANKSNGTNMRPRSARVRRMGTFGG